VNGFFLLAQLALFVVAITQQKEVGYVFTSVCLSVCLWPKEKVIRFWW